MNKEKIWLKMDGICFQKEKFSWKTDTSLPSYGVLRLFNFSLQP